MIKKHRMAGGPLDSMMVWTNEAETFVCPDFSCGEQIIIVKIIE
jgi:hypothetical protein